MIPAVTIIEAIRGLEHYPNFQHKKSWQSREILDRNPAMQSVVIPRNNRRGQFRQGGGRNE